jgi:hypothetical protein
LENEEKRHVVSFSFRKRAFWPAYANEGAVLSKRKPRTATATAIRKDKIMRTTKKDRVVTDQEIVAGLQKHLGKTGKLLVDGTSYSVGELLTVLTRRIAVTGKVVEAHAAWRACVAAERETMNETASFIGKLRQAIVVAMGTSSPSLGDFGLAPRQKARPLTAVEKVQRNAKAQATRQKRHTMGRRQRTGVKAKGDVTVIVMPDVPAPGNGANGASTPSPVAGAPPAAPANEGAGGG